jgi:Arc/MetJ-type ribon-helix-helix transcriptional regulator
MARNDKSAPTETINIRMPKALLAELDRMVQGGETPYSNRSDLIKSAVRKELDDLERRKRDMIIEVDERGRELR